MPVTQRKSAPLFYSTCLPCHNPYLVGPVAHLNHQTQPTKADLQHLALTLAKSANLVHIKQCPAGSDPQPG